MPVTLSYEMTFSLRSLPLKLIKLNIFFIYPKCKDLTTKDKGSAIIVILISIAAKNSGFDNQPWWISHAACFTFPECSLGPTC